jgi:Ca2+-binding RTX toxin-like protein
MRALTLIATAGLVLGGILVADPLAPATAHRGGATCAGRAVTIDLNDPDHPDPRRARADVVLGTPGNDRIPTWGGRDVVCGRGGFDVLNGGAGDDLLVGGRGSDWVVYRQAKRAVTVDLAVKRPQRTGWGLDTLRGIENVDGSGTHPNILRGGDHANHLSGGSAQDLIDGRAGADRLDGEAGRDVLSAGSGDDYLRAGTSPGGSREQLYGGPGDDYLAAGRPDELLDGGPGSDVVSYFYLVGGVTVDLRLDVAQDTGSGGRDELVGVEWLDGSQGDDQLRGDAGANDLYGGIGDDRLNGRRGTDVCDGGPGADVISNCETKVPQRFPHSADRRGLST